MGTCDCGQPTVWNDMCQDCNNAFEDRIYERYSDVPKDYSWSNMKTHETNKSSFFSNEVLNLHMDMSKICGVSGLDQNCDFLVYYPNGVAVKIVTIGPSFELIREEYGKMLDFLKSVYN